MALARKMIAARMTTPKRQVTVGIEARFMEFLLKRVVLTKLQAANRGQRA
jgi:hypothetical protein